METVLLVLALLAGLVLVPFGLPGLWLMVGAVLLYSYAVPDSISLGTIILLAVLALIAELLEFTVSARYTRRYGGSRRAAWGAIGGGIVGAVIGVPVPLVGSVVGAFVGSFAGALLAELSLRSDVGSATRVATGALLGRAVAAAIKVAIGIVMAVWALFALWV